MRLWHYKLLEFLPELQFKGQCRELRLILNDLENKGCVNHLLINRLMLYGSEELYKYVQLYRFEYAQRYGKNCNLPEVKLSNKAVDFENVFPGWHDKDYLRVCMANLYEKHKFGIGKSRISDDEWQRLLVGYKRITGEDYKI